MTGEKRGTSLVLTGAGSYAAYEVGVMSALFAGRSPSTGHVPLEPDVLFGTSAGAMNAAALLAHEVRTGSLSAAAEAMRQLWISRIAESPDTCGNGVYRIRGLPFPFFERACRRRGITPLLADAAGDAALFLRGSLHAAVDFLFSPELPVRALAQYVDISALISITPFLETLQAILPLDDFARTTRRIRIIALDLTAGQTRFFDEGDVRRLGYQPLLASTALPVFFPPVRIDGHEFVNGTALSTSPLPPAIEETDTIHIVYMDPQLSNISPARLEDFIDAVDRVSVVNFAYVINRVIRQARVINAALELIAAGTPAEQLGRRDVYALLRALGPIRRRIEAGNPYRPLTIHRYHPREDLGGDLGLMNLDPGRIEDVIERGYAETVAHDCEASGCVLPGRNTMPPAPTAAGALVPLSPSKYSGVSTPTTTEDR